MPDRLVLLLNAERFLGSTWPDHDDHMSDFSDSGGQYVQLMIGAQGRLYLRDQDELLCYGVKR